MADSTDDAARFMVGGKILNRSTSKECIQALDTSVKEYGKPKQAMSDRGIQFTASPREECPDPGPTEFQKYLEMKGI